MDTPTKDTKTEEPKLLYGVASKEKSLLIVDDIGPSKEDNIRIMKYIASLGGL